MTNHNTPSLPGAAGVNAAPVALPLLTLADLLAAGVDERDIKRLDVRAADGWEIRGTGRITTIRRPRLTEPFAEFCVEDEHPRTGLTEEWWYELPVGDLVICEQDEARVLIAEVEA